MDLSYLAGAMLGATLASWILFRLGRWLFVRGDDADAIVMLSLTILALEFLLSYFGNEKKLGESIVYSIVVFTPGLALLTVLAIRKLPRA